MKRCGQCERDYFDDSLLYCLEDGSALFESSGRDEPETAILTPHQPFDANSIAVLPFLNISADPENEYFCDGLAEELLNALSHIDGLKVAARTSTFSFKGKVANVAEIGRKLGVRTILEGSVQKAGNRVRISVQLSNASDGYHLWSERYDRELKDIFDIQDEISLAVVDALKLTLLGSGRSKVLKRYTDNAEAYSLYLRGRFFWNKRTTEGTRRAIELYEQAIAMDPNYALAYSGIADCYNSSGFAYDLGAMPAVEVTAKAKNAAMKALELDDTLAEAHTSLAYAKHLFDWDWEGAEVCFRRALELNPNYANARHWFAHLLIATGRMDEALAESERALELDPLSSVMNTHLGWHYMYAREYDTAMRHLDYTLLLEPDFPLAAWYKGLIYEQQGLYRESEAAFERAMSPSVDNLFIRADAAHMYAVSGQKERVKSELAEFEAMAKDRYVSSFRLAVICVGVGEDDRAFEYFDKALAEHSDMLVYLNLDPRFDRLRSDKRFQELVSKVGLPQQNL